VHRFPDIAQPELLEELEPVEELEAVPDEELLEEVAVTVLDDVADEVDVVAVLVDAWVVLLEPEVAVLALCEEPFPVEEAELPPFEPEQPTINASPTQPTTAIRMAYPPPPP
jgi:hypothetical protein